MTANRAASIRARLNQHPDTSKQDFNLTLTQYGLERLLYRLPVYDHASSLVMGADKVHAWCIRTGGFMCQTPLSLPCR